MLWLKAFNRVLISSVFDDGGSKKRRTFEFTYSEDGVEKHHVESAKPDEPVGTSVKLLGMKADYRDKVPRSIETLGARIIEHCLEFLALGSCPRLILEDVTLGEEIDLNAEYRDSFRTSRESFAIGAHPFTITHVMVPPRPNEKHELHFCAHNRAVSTQPLVGEVPDLVASLKNVDTGDAFVYAGYVSSDLLNDHVTAERTAFDFPADDGLRSDKDVSWEQIESASVGRSSEFLSRHTAATKEQKIKQVQDYVANEAPQYRPLIKHRPEIIDQIPPNLSPDKLDVELYKLNQKYDSSLQEKYHQILGDRIEMESFDKFKNFYDGFLEEWNERGVSMLAQHVLHRKATLDFLRTRLHMDGEGKYAKEEAIHEVVFPLRTTSDDVPAARMNLWILDESLAYHYYLASDKQMRSVEPIQNGSAKELDLLIFNNPFAFAEEDAPRFGSVVIVEFKKPLRNDYSNEDNPIDQVITYVEELRSGRAKDRKGRPIQFPGTLPIHAIIVCDFTDKLRQLAARRQFKPAADQSTYFHFHENYSAFFELLSFDAMLDRAERRNKILFDKIGVKDLRFPRDAEPANSASTVRTASK